MRVHSLSLGFVLLCLLSFCNADHETFDILGVADCADCQLNNFNPTYAFSGLHVTIDCKLEKEMKRVGEGELDGDGKFKISLPKEMIGDVKKNCYAQLHSAAAAPCPAHGGLEATEIILKSEMDEKITFSPAKTLRFSTALCTSKLLWPLFQYPPLPKADPWKKVWPKISIPPLKKHHRSFPPTYKPKPKPKPKVVKTLPQPVPTYKPKPSVPIYKPPTKPIPPTFHKPTPKPPVVKPIYKPPVVKPIYKPLPPSVPIYKPLPPPFLLFPLPPLYKKRCPPFAAKSFDHPKFGYFPKLPSFNPNP